MGNATSWLAQSLCPEEQVLWVAAKSGDHELLNQALARLTPQTRYYLEWRDPLYGYSPLANASAQGHLHCVRALLHAGADVNARDVHGNTPLHLATKSGKSEVVHTLLAAPAVDVLVRNASRLQTALDLARHAYRNASEDAHKYIQCIELLEQKLCVYTGWLYLRADNLLSMASGLSALHSWKRRYCVVLRTAESDVVEIDLFSMKVGEKRPPCPSTELVYRAVDGIHTPDSNSSWFSRQEFRFALHAVHKSGINRVSAPQTFDFAAMSQAELVAWKTFFASLQFGAVSHSNISNNSSNSNAIATGAMTSTTNNTTNLVAPAPSLVLQQQPPQHIPHALQLLGPTPQSIGIGIPVASAPPLVSFDSFGSPEATLAPDGVEIVQPLHGRDDDSGRAHWHRSTGSASATTVPTAPDASHAGTGECVICFDGPQSAVCVPCGHNAICMDCAEEILETTRLCPVCRSTVREVIKLFRV